jgi:two-component system sensor histidine kinase BaeS
MRWYKSLYWRIAIGFVAFLAAMLVVQAMLFTWAIARSGQTLPGQSPARFAQTVAIDLANALERDPKLDVAHYVREQYAQVTHPFFVLLADERIVSNSNEPIPDPLIRIARARLHRRPDWPDRPDAERFLRFGRGDGDRPDRDPTGFKFLRPVPIVVNGDIAGVVVVPPRASFGFLLSRFAPMLAFVAAGVLIVGTIGASVMIFGPARRRLRALESAARRFGGGDLSARAPERGGDEVAAVASAFNAMADDLATRAEALAASDKARRQLLADVSHELTTPVTAMRGYLETLTMPELELDDATRTRYLGIIGDETARLERIIGDLLDLARLEGGGGSLKLEDVPVAGLFERVAARHEPTCRTAQVTIEHTIQPGANTIVGDRDRLEQALQNLAANAIRYAPPGSTVRLTARRVEDGVAITVEDDGPGIAQEHLPHLFDRFYKTEASRAGTVSGSSGGSGLGLSIVKAIVERHGGRIAVTSRPGRTVFEVVLPRG